MAISYSIERTLKLLSFEFKILRCGLMYKACDAFKERQYDNQFRASAQIQKMILVKFEEFMKT